MGYEYNRRLHRSELDVLQKLQEGKTPEEQRRLELAAKYLVKANEGANVNDQLKPFLDEMVAEGAQYVKEAWELQALAKARKVELKNKLREQRIKRPEGGRDTISLKEFEDLQNGKHLEGTKAITLEVRFEQKAEAEQIRWGKNKLEEFDFPTPTNNKQRFVEFSRLMLNLIDNIGGK